MGNRYHIGVFITQVSGTNNSSFKKQRMLQQWMISIFDIPNS